MSQDRRAESLVPEPCGCQQTVRDLLPSFYPQENTRHVIRLDSVVLDHAYSSGPRQRIPDPAARNRTYNSRSST